MLASRERPPVEVVGERPESAPREPTSGIGPAAPRVVKVERYEGPLDLLLALIERRELDITAVSIATVADQYLAQLRQLAPLPADELAGFLVIAGKLLWIKSRALLPRESAPADDSEEDPAEALAERLREYRAFKQAAAALAELDARGARAYPRVAAPPTFNEARLAPTTPRQLLRALERLLALTPRRLDANQIAGTPIRQITVADQMATIRQALATGRAYRFACLTANQGSRHELIVAFLALLELWKRGEITVHQDGIFGDITMELAQSPSDTP